MGEGVRSIVVIVVPAAWPWYNWGRRGPCVGSMELAPHVLTEDSFNDCSSLGDYDGGLFG
jgi:hypothetical protein